MRIRIRRLMLALGALAIMVFAPELGAQHLDECEFCVEDCPIPFNMIEFCDTYCDDEEFNGEWAPADCDDNQPPCPNFTVACYGFM